MPGTCISTCWTKRVEIFGYRNVVPYNMDGNVRAARTSKYVVKRSYISVPASKMLFTKAFLARCGGAILAPYALFY